jgi:hypothetical protein
MMASSDHLAPEEILKRKKKLLRKRKLKDLDQSDHPVHERYAKMGIFKE